MAELLALRGVEKSYRRGPRVLRVLVDVSLAVRAGQVVAVIGARGEGKTTLLKLAAGLELADSGEVCFAGRPLSALARRERRRLLGGEIRWLDRRDPRLRLPVRDLVAAPMMMGRGYGRRQARASALAALDRLGVGAAAGQCWDDISNWERMLVELAAGIVDSPSLLVIDDLLDGLGASRTREAARLLRGIVEDLGVGVLMSVSDWDAALGADRILSFVDRGLTLMSDQTLDGDAAELDADVLPFARPRANGANGSHGTSAC